MRVMSWNLHGLKGADGRRDPERVARVIDDVRPDVAGLQEVGLPRAPGDPPDPAQLLARLTGMRGAFGATMSHGPGFPYGNAVLSRHPILALRNYDLSVPRREPRGCVRVDVELSGARVHFFSAHLGLHWRERRRQAAQLLSADILRDTALAYPLVLVGDFNAWSSRSAVPRWIRRQLMDAAGAAQTPRATFPAAVPLVRLDRAYVDSAVRVLACSVHDTRLARLASDHLPLVVDVELAPAARRPPPARPIAARGVTTEVR